MAMKLVVFGAVLGTSVFGGLAVLAVNKLRAEISALFSTNEQHVDEAPSNVVYVGAQQKSTNHVSKWNRVDTALGKFIRKRFVRFVQNKVSKRRSTKPANTTLTLEKLNKKHPKAKKRTFLPKFNLK